MTSPQIILLAYGICVWMCVCVCVFEGLIRCVDRVPEELWMEVHDIVQEAVIKTIPKKKKCKKVNRLSWRPYK